MLVLSKPASLTFYSQTSAILHWMSTTVKTLDHFAWLGGWRTTMENTFWCVTFCLLIYSFYNNHITSILFSIFVVVFWERGTMTISFTCSEKVSSDVVSSHLIRDLLNVLIFVLGVTNSHISVNMLHYSVAVRQRVEKKMHTTFTRRWLRQETGQRWWSNLKFFYLFIYFGGRGPFRGGRSIMSQNYLTVRRTDSDRLQSLSYRLPSHL